MRTFRFLFLLVLLLLCVLAVSACTGDGDTVTTAPTTTAEATTTAVTTTAPVTTATAGLAFTPTRDGEGYVVSGYLDESDKATEVLVIPATHEGKPVVEIGHASFCAMTALRKVYIPSSVEVISYAAFYGCSSLTDVVFAEDSRCHTLKERAFRACTSLADITLPASLDRIERYVFLDCSGLENVRFAGEIHAWHVTDPEDSEYHYYFSHSEVKYPSTVAYRLTQVYTARVLERED